LEGKLDDGALCEGKAGRSWACVELDDGALCEGKAGRSWACVEVDAVSASLVVVMVTSVVVIETG
jgi:hypothetical protein